MQQNKKIVITALLPEKNRKATMKKIVRETTMIAEEQETNESDIKIRKHQNDYNEEMKRESSINHDEEEEEEIFSPVDGNENEIFSPFHKNEDDEIFSPVERNDTRQHDTEKADDINEQTTPKKRKMKRSETKYEESSTTESLPSIKTTGNSRNRNTPNTNNNNNNNNKVRRNSEGYPQSLENNILRWSKEEKDLLRLKEKLLNNNVDFGDYSILMYETQDAFNHCRNLRLQLQISDQQVRLKTKQCNSLMAQREEMKRAEHQRRKTTQDREVVLKEKLRKTEQRLIDVYGENEWLQGTVLLLFSSYWVFKKKIITPLLRISMENSRS